MKRISSALLSTSVLVAAAALTSSSAFATDGMFGNGTGARNKALAGAGVADQNDATAIAINPAGLVNSDSQFSASASLFSPRREYTMNGGTVESESDWFVVPNIAYNTKVDSNTAFGVSIYGNGGMNTDYPSNLFGFGPNEGVDLTQAFISAGVAKRYGSISVGFAPIVAIQMFKADGLGAFGAPEKLNVAAGVGARAGIEWAMAPGFRVGVSGTTPIWSQAFTDYDTNLLAASNGVIDVPATVQAGVAFDLMPNLTIMADYKRIFYSGSEAIATSPTATPFGFGWSDINVYKVGVEWDATPGLTLRAGYSYNDSPLPAITDSGNPTDFYNFAVNVLTPATVQHHITGGAKIKMTNSIDLELAGMYALNAKNSGDFTACTVPPPVCTPASMSGSVGMHQYEATVGIVMHLGDAEPPLK